MDGSPAQGFFLLIGKVSLPLLLAGGQALGFDYNRHYISKDDLILRCLHDDAPALPSDDPFYAF